MIPAFNVHILIAILKNQYHALGMLYLKFLLYRFRVM